MYIADFGNNRIRKVTVSTGIITTIAGTGTNSYTGDGGAATSATLFFPSDMALDASGKSTCPIFSLTNISCVGNVYIADRNNHRIRKVTVSTGIINTFAGTGTSSFSGDGDAATSAALYYPTGLALDSSGSCTPFYYFTAWYYNMLSRQRVHR